MPFALPAAASAIAAAAPAAAAAAPAAAATAAKATLMTTLKTVAFNAATSMAISAALSAFQPVVGQSGRTFEFVIDPDGPIPFAAGRVGVAGSVIHRDTFGPDLMFYGIPAVLSGAGPITAIDSVMADDYPMSFDSNGGATTEPYRYELYMRTVLGHQPAPVALSTPSGLKKNAALPGWTAQHKLSGKAAFLMVMAENSKGSAFPTGEVKPLITLRGLKVYDPRQDSTYPGGSGPQRLNDPSTWTYSANPLLWALKWCLGLWEGPNGKGAPQVDFQVGGIGAKPSGIDFPAFIAAANIADANGWTVSAYPNTDDDKSQVLDAFLQAGGCIYAQRAGKMSCIQRAAPRASVVTISVQDTAGPLEIDTAASRIDRINTLRPRFWSEPHRWQMTALTGEITAQAYRDEDGSVRSRGLDYPYVSDAKQCGQLAALQIANTREGIAGVIPLKPHLQRIRPGDAFTITEPGFVLDGLKCLCLHTDYDPATGIVRVSFVSETDAKYPFALGQNPTPPTPQVLTPVDPRFVSPPEPGDWTITPRPPAPGGGQLPGFDLGGIVSNETATAIIVEYGPTATGPWKQAYQGPPTVTNIPIDGVQPGGTYYIAVQYQREQNFSERYVYGPYTAPLLVSDDTTHLNGTPVEEITDRLVDVEALSAANAVAVGELEEVYGDTASAAASAASAAASEAASAQAAADAVIAKGAAQAAATGAAAEALSAAGSATSANQSKLDAQTAQAAASNSATGAANSATNAAGSAATATQQAGLAATARDAAAGSATAANTSAGNAAASATAAGNSATASQASSVSASTSASNALLSASALWPERYGSTGQSYFTSALTGDPVTRPLRPSNINIEGFGPAVRLTPPAGSVIDFTHRMVLTATPGRIYRVEVEVQRQSVTGTGTGIVAVQLRTLDSNYADTFISARAGNNPLNGDVQVFSAMFADAATAAGKSGVTSWGATAVWLRPFVRLERGSNVTDVTADFRRLKVTDVTEAYQAQASATAAATSASSAAASQTAAGQSATAANQSKLDAQTAQAAASNSATGAANSATSAAGSAATATTQAGLAATARDAAAGSATAANTSAGNAAASATAAGNSATASQASSVTASTARDDALAAKAATETARDQAQSSASAAATSASSASASQTAAGQSASAAANSATAANTSAGNASTSASQASTSATNAAGSASTAGTAATNAANSRDAAAGSASAAAGSASTATTKAGEAGTSAAAAAASQVSASTSAGAALLSAASLWPERYDSQSYFTASATGDPATTPLFPSNVNIEGFGPGARRSASGGATAVIDWAHRMVLPATPGRIYRVECELQRQSMTGTGTGQLRLSMRTLEADYQGGAVNAALVMLNGNVQVGVGLFADAATAAGKSGVTSWGATAVWLRPYARLEPGTNNTAVTADFRRLKVTDVTEAYQAQASATAAATSASSASASQTAAGQSATAAAGSATTANTAAGQASTFATQASNSATNAAGSASSASTSAGTAATARDQANAASSSAQASAATATTQASNAAGSAAAASISANLAASVGSPNANLTVNGGFELGNASGWVLPAGYTFGSNQDLGGPVVYASISSAGQTYPAGPLTNCDSGYTGTYSAQIAYKATVPGFTQICVLFFSDAAGTVNIGQTPWRDISASSVPLTVWKEEGFSKPANAKTMRVSLGVNHNGGGTGEIILARCKMEAGPKATGYSSDASVRQQSASLSVTSAVAADAQARLSSAQFQVIAAAGSAPAQLLIRADQSGSLAALVAQAISFSNVVGGQIVEVMKLVGGDVFISGRLYVGSNKQVEINPFGPWISWKVGGANLIIGAVPQDNMILWFGPAMDVSAMRKSNATMWFDTSGNARFLGSIFAGRLSNSVQGTSLIVPSSSTVGPFITEGGPINIAWSYNYNRNAFRLGQQGAIGDSSAQVRLFRKIGGGNEELVSTQNITGSSKATVHNVADPHETPQYQTELEETISGSFTYMDTAGGTADRTYRMEVTSRVNATFSGNGGSTESQRTSVVTSEG